VTQRTRHLADASSEFEDTEGVILSLTTSNHVSKESRSFPKFWYVNCSVGSITVRFLVDTGSQVTTIPEKLAIASGHTITASHGCHLRAFGGSKPTIKGKLDNVKVEYGMISAIGTILISDDDEQPLLGMNFISSLNLLSGLVCSPITLSKDSEFVASFRLKQLDGMKHAARTLPFSMKSLVEVELKRLLDLGVIFPVENPRISAPIVPVWKQVGAARPIRICGDYSCTLNRIIDPDAYTIPKLQVLLEKIPNAFYYSVLDLEDAYLQISLSEESQLLTCVSTH